MNKKKKVLLLAGLCVGASLSAMEVEPADSLINLKGVVVTANKIQVSRGSVPLSVSVVEREEIEASSESALLPVLSERVPGLFVTEKGVTGFGVSEGAAGTVNVRGVGQGNKVLMLFDGQPQWAGVFGHALPDTYVASDVERVEVIRGPGSLLYGSNAMGGVVNVITRKHSQPGRRTNGRLMFGSYNTQKYMLNNGYNAGKFSSYLSLNHDRTDGHRPNSAFHITNGFVKLGYRFDNHFNLTGDLSLAKFKNQNPGKVEQPIEDNIMRILRGTTSAAFENRFDKTSGALRVFYAWGHHKIDDGHNPGEAPSPYLFYSDDHNAGFQLYQSFRVVPGGNYTVGLDYKNWGGHAWNDSIQGGQADLVKKTVDEVAAYVVLQQDLLEKLTLNAGVRYERNSVFGGEWVPQAGLAFRPFEGNAIKLSVSKGFRSPTIREMYMFPPQNPDLKPERMWNYEVSVGQTLLEGNLSLEATAFYIDGSDLIQVTKVDGRPRNTNVGTFTNKGVEFEARYRILPNLSVDMNYSYLHTSKPLLAAPAHKFFTGVTYAPGRFTFNVNVQSIFDLYVNTDKAAQEDYTLLNAKAAYRLGTREKGMAFFVKGENLTATRYTINEGFPMPKATVMAGVDFTF